MQPVDTTVFIAFVVGALSFLSPCVLPLVPGYLSTISGLNMEQFSERSNKRLLLQSSILFIASFSCIFILLGLGATAIGSSLQTHRQQFQTLAGILIFSLGLFFLATQLFAKLNLQWRHTWLLNKARQGGPIVAGSAFAIAWTPCVGPTLGAILTAAAIKDSLASGAILLVAYSAGLALPFLLAALAFSRMTKVFSWLSKHHLAINLLAGITLVAMGTLIFTNEFTTINAWVQQIMDKLGLSFVYSI